MEARQTRWPNPSQSGTAQLFINWIFIALAEVAFKVG